MNQEEVKIGLDAFVKQELVDMFSSLALNIGDKKEVLIANIVNADPPASPSEIAAFKRQLTTKSEPSPKPEKLVYVYIVVSAIKEDGKDFKPGKEYTGKFVERFLKGGQIRKKD